MEEEKRGIGLEWCCGRLSADQGARREGGFGIEQECKANLVLDLAKVSKYEP